MWKLKETVEKISQYVTVQCGIRHLSPDSVKSSYLPGIAASFDMPGPNQGENLFREAISVDAVKKLIKGFERLYALRNPKANRLKLAFGMDLALMSRDVMTRLRTFHERGRSEAGVEIRQRRVFVAMAVGIFFMLRRSEHLIAKDRKGPSPLTRRCVLFFDGNGLPIPYARVGLTVAEKVMLNVTFSKTDYSGFGRRTYHVRQPQLSSTCVVTILEDWIRTTRDTYGAKEDDPLYHLPGCEPLTLEALHYVMEATVKALGVAGNGIMATSHSLRYGGATMLAAAGFPQYLIAHYGGWKENSAALRIYARPSEESIAMVSEFMARITLKNPSSHYIRDLLLRQHAKPRRGEREW